MNAINLYSMVLVGAAALGLAALLLLRRGASRGRLLALAGLAAALLGLWWLTRPVQSPPAELENLRAQIGAGQAVLLEFQSPY